MRKAGRLLAMMSRIILGSMKGGMAMHWNNILQLIPDDSIFGANPEISWGYLCFL